MFVSNGSDGIVRAAGMLDVPSRVWDSEGSREAGWVDIKTSVNDTSFHIYKCQP